MSALGIALAVAIGAGVGYAVGRHVERDRSESARSEELAQAFRKGQHHGHLDGWTAGRVQLIAEQRSLALHPASSSHAAAVRGAAEVVDLEAARIEREGL